MPRLTATLIVVGCFVGSWFLPGIALAQATGDRVLRQAEQRESRLVDADHPGKEELFNMCLRLQDVIGIEVKNREQSIDQACRAVPSLGRPREWKELDESIQRSAVRMGVLIGEDMHHGLRLEQAVAHGINCLIGNEQMVKGLEDVMKPCNRDLTYELMSYMADEAIDSVFRRAGIQIKAYCDCMLEAEMQAPSLSHDLPVSEEHSECLPQPQLVLRGGAASSVEEQAELRQIEIKQREMMASAEILLASGSNSNKEKAKKILRRVISMNTDTRCAEKAGEYLSKLEEG